jgi:hypothetical protein
MRSLSGVTESLSDVTTLSNRITNLEASPQFQPYSKVIIHVSDETTIVEGNDSGRTIEIDNPYGTQEMARNMLASLSGYQYQPYYANGALLDPAAEIGDGANMRDTYGGIYTRSRTFGRLMKADISAPHDEEINHEYKFESPQERKFTRQVDDLRASLIVANDRIDASVSQTGGSSSSFGWSLTSDAHRWYANGQEVMSVTQSGLSVRGVITATSGSIGGFNIGSSSLYNGMTSLNSTASGVYVGTDGISVGGGNFKVTSSGAVSAANMTLTGTLNIGGSTITAAQLRSGAQSAYNNGDYWSSGAGYGHNYNSATVNNTSKYPPHFTCGSLRCNYIRLTGNFMVGTTMCSLKTKTFMYGIGVTRSQQYVTGITSYTDTITYIGA